MGDVYVLQIDFDTEQWSSVEAIGVFKNINQARRAALADFDSKYKGKTGSPYRVNGYVISPVSFGEVTDVSCLRDDEVWKRDKETDDLRLFRIPCLYSKTGKVFLEEYINESEKLVMYDIDEEDE